MAKQKKVYKKLCRAVGAELGSAVSTRYSLWDGEDHLLYVIKEGFAEQYRRFYYRDIQALVVCESVTGRVTTITLSLLSLFFLLLVTRGLTAAWPIAATLTVGVIDALFLVGLVVNWLMGPTCTAYIYTAVQRERLFPLDRIRRAQKIMDKIRTHAEAVQGQLSAEEAERLALAQPDAPTRAERVSAFRAKQKKERRKTLLKPYASKSHKVLFAALLTHLAYCYLRFLLHGNVMFVVGICIWAWILYALVVSIIKQRGTNLTGMIKGVTWLSLLYVFVHGCISYVYYIVYAIMDSPDAASWEAAARSMANTPATDSTLLYILLIFSCVGSGGLGLTGIFLHNRFDRTRLVASDPPDDSVERPAYSTPDDPATQQPNNRTTEQ